MESYCLKYLEHISEIFAAVRDTQWEKIDHAAKIMSDAIENKRSVYVFGASHAGILAQEMFYRTGGLAVINAILPSEYMLNIRPITQTSAMERLPGYTRIVLEQSLAQKGDVLIVHSVSGRNTAAIEMALTAKEKGMKTIAITNMEYSQNVTSRHSSGKKLYEVCDVVIDNCGDFEDASMLLPKMDQKIAPTSSVIGCAIVNMLEIRTVELLLQNDITPPVFHSANVDGGEEFNQKLFAEYKDQIHYMQ